MRSFDPLGLHGQFTFPYFEVWHMNGNVTYPETIEHPETGEFMVLDKTQGHAAMFDRLTKNVGNAEGGRQVLDKVAAKEAKLGRIYVNPMTGYQHRFKPDDAAGAAGSAGAAGEAAGERGGPTHPDPEVERLRRELREAEEKAAR